MEMFLQFGYGMMEHCRHLIGSWGGGSVILSPRDLSDEQLTRLAEGTRDAGGSVLVDPQFYLPNADHERLVSHDYWPSDYESDVFFTGPGARELLERLGELNQRLGTDRLVLPGLLCTQVDDIWLSRHEEFVRTARAMNLDNRAWSTLALSSDVIRSRDQISELIESCSRWNAATFYLVCEHPNGDYLVSDPIWLAHVLDLIAGLRLAGSEVVVGYCNHQMLAADLAGANAICSGTWMNVRCFPPDKFRSSYEEEIRRRTTWFYCPQALSEYKLPFMDMAFEAGILDLEQAKIAGESARDTAYTLSRDRPLPARVSSE